jgi:PKHD-type hydroxylase
MINDPVNRSAVYYDFAHWDNIFDDKELSDIVSYCENKELITGAVVRDKNITDHRRSKVNFHKMSPETRWIFDRLNWLGSVVNENYFGFDLIGYDHFQYSIYDSADLGYYNWHIDSDINFAEPHNNGLHRKMSMSLLLNDGFEGGNLEFNPGTPSSHVIPKGRAMFFPSTMLHRVAPVTKGIRKSLVVLFLGPKWK